jgi:GH24 family phage-related lysozyme (muramidase)
MGGLSLSGTLGSDPFLDFEAPLRKGDKDSHRSTRVNQLQRELRNAGYSMVHDSGEFDLATESAVRSFQCKHDMMENGIADATFLRALSRANGPIGLRTDPTIPFNPSLKPFLSGIHNIDGAFEPPLPPTALRTSPTGKRMMRFNESSGDYKKTKYLHHPSDSSGVTIGFGYDMKERNKTSIQMDLMRIGVAKEVAAQVAEASGKKGSAADAFVDKYGEKAKSPLICLEDAQQDDLMNIYLKDKERLVKTHVHVNLLQREFDALVSFAVNPGAKALQTPRFAQVAHDINHGWVSDALDLILTAVPSDPKVRKGVMTRRHREVQFYLTGRYR